MSDENPPEASEPLLKKATVRISLPPKPTGGVGDSKETLRITLPQAVAKTATIRVAGMNTEAPAEASAPAPSSSPSAPFVPPAPTARGPLPPPPASKLAGPPRPPGLSGLAGLKKPPTTPIAAPATSPLSASAAPAVLKPTAPKKETTRIQVAPEAKVMPKATVKLQQAAPIAPMPAVTIKTAVEPIAENEVEVDPLLLPLSAVASFAGLISAILSFLAFSA